MKNLFWHLGRGVAFVYRLHALRLASIVFRRVDHPSLIKRAFFGKSLFLDVSRSKAQQLLWLQGERYIEERHLLKQLVRPGMTVVDVGANIGFYALMLNSYLNGQGAIICLEPDPTNLIELRANVAANRLAQHISILPMAAGSEDGTVSFEPGLNAHAAEAGTLQVAVRKLDSLNLAQVDFIKMDVEGYEGAVLDGARSLIERCRPTLFLELHPQLLTPHSHGEIVQFLQTHYTQLSVYQVARGSWWMRALRSYGMANCLKRLDHLQELVAAYEAGTMEHTSWIVAQA